MHRSTLISLFAFCLPTAAIAQDTSGEQVAETSEFVGIYDGSSFETAVGMAVLADGTFSWALSVGGLDLRAKGRWFEEDGAIIFESDPKPVLPEFVLTKRDDGVAQDGPFLRLVWAGSERAFSYPGIYAKCANGEVAYGYADEEGWSPQGECDKVTHLQFRMPSYSIKSQVFDLTGERAPKHGETIRVEFHANDLGLVNFDGTMGQMKDGELVIRASFGEVAMRKLPPPQSPVE